MPSLEVCLTHELIHLYPPTDKNVVVVDILRATSCMVTALANGVESITPVASVDECRELQQKGYLAAAERNGQHVEGFDLGNSPLSYIDNDFTGRKLAMTTTNGTLAITKSKAAKEVLIGAFLNLSALAEYLKSKTDDLLIVCSGWKGKVSFEDTLFAGALVGQLQSSYEMDCDSAVIALELFKSSKNDLLSAIQKSSHYNRLQKLNIERDFEFCVTVDKYPIVPVLMDGVLVRVPG